MQQLMKRIDSINAATEHQKVSTFLRGLESHYKFHVRANNPVTLAAAVNTAKGFELSYNELAIQPLDIVQNTNANTEIVALLSEMQKQISMFENQNQTNTGNTGGSNQRSSDNNRNRSSTNSFDSDCHNCGRRGHIAKDCWTRQNSHNRPNNYNNGNRHNNNNNNNYNNNQNNGYNNNRNDSYGNRNNNDQNYSNNQNNNQNS